MIAYAHHQSELEAVVDGVVQRDMWEHRARGRGEGAQLARDRLEELPFPEELRFFWGWGGELVGRSGTSEGRPNRLTFTTVLHWSQVTGNRPTPLEVWGLMQLDSALLGLSRPVRDEQKESEEKPPQMAWPPKRKVDG